MDYNGSTNYYCFFVSFVVQYSDLKTWNILAGVRRLLNIYLFAQKNQHVLAKKSTKNRQKIFPMLYLPPLSLLFFEAKKNTPKTKQRDFETALNHKKAFLQQENACPKKNNENPPFLAWGMSWHVRAKKASFGFRRFLVSQINMLLEKGTLSFLFSNRGNDPFFFSFRHISFFYCQRRSMKKARKVFLFPLCFSGSI